MNRRRACGLLLVCVAFWSGACSVDRKGSAPPALPDTNRPGDRVSARARLDSGIRVRLSEARASTYINEMFEDRDARTVVRWDVQAHSILTVHIPRQRSVPGFRDAFTTAVRNAFAEWETAGIPARFDLHADSARALIHVAWVERFSINRTGETLLRWEGPEGRITNATLKLALHNPAGHRLLADHIYVVALHEIGHLLGLGHSRKPTDVMHPETRAERLTSRDRQTARVLYQLPHGPLP